MQRLITTSVVIPTDNEGRNFRYLHQETSHWSHSPVYDEFVRQYLAHRKANGLPIPDDYESVIQDQMCQTLPPEWCERTGGQSWVSTRFGYDDFLSGMKAFAGLLTGKYKFVGQEEADRRARICSNCYYNISIPGCNTCRKLSEFVTGDVAGKTTQYDEKLKACAVCKCANQAQTWFPMDALEETDTPEKQALYPNDFCWKSKTSPNYLPNENLPPLTQGGQVVSREAHTLESRVQLPSLP